jgi:hypothetical protein
MIKPETKWLRWRNVGRGILIGLVILLLCPFAATEIKLGTKIVSIALGIVVLVLILRHNRSIRNLRQMEQDLNAEEDRAQRVDRREEGK